MKLLGYVYTLVIIGALLLVIYTVNGAEDVSANELPINTFSKNVKKSKKSVTEFSKATQDSEG